MLWISADLASTSGVALWRGPELVRTAVLRAVGAKGRYRFGTQVRESEMLAWLDAFCAAAPLEHRPGALVIEEGHVSPKMIGAAMSLAERRGRVLAWWEATGPGRPVHRVRPAEWRRVAREAFDCSWPKDGPGCKALAVSLVREHYGREVTEDEADAVLVGHWALRTRHVE